MDKTPGATGQRVVVTGEGIHKSESSDQGPKQKRLCQRQIASNSTEAMVTHTIWLAIEQRNWWNTRASSQTQERLIDIECIRTLRLLLNLNWTAHYYNWALYAQCIFLVLLCVCGLYLGNFKKWVLPVEILSLGTISHHVQAVSYVTCVHINQYVQAGIHNQSMLKTHSWCVSKARHKTACAKWACSYQKCGCYLNSLQCQIFFFAVIDTETKSKPTMNDIRWNVSM